MDDYYNDDDGIHVTSLLTAVMLTVGQKSHIGPRLCQRRTQTNFTISSVVTEAYSALTAWRWWHRKEAVCNMLLGLRPESFNTSDPWLIFLASEQALL